MHGDQGTGARPVQAAGSAEGDPDEALGWLAGVPAPPALLPVDPPGFGGRGGRPEMMSSI
jgi:hypothetical protein